MKKCLAKFTSGSRVFNQHSGVEVAWVETAGILFQVLYNTKKSSGAEACAQDVHMWYRIRRVYGPMLVA